MIEGKSPLSADRMFTLWCVVRDIAFSGGDEQGVQVVRRAGKGRLEEKEDQAPGRSVQDHRTGQCRADSLPPSLPPSARLTRIVQRC